MKTIKCDNDIRKGSNVSYDYQGGIWKVTEKNEGSANCHMGVRYIQVYYTIENESGEVRSGVRRKDLNKKTDTYFAEALNA